MNDEEAVKLLNNPKSLKWPPDEDRIFYFSSYPYLLNLAARLSSEDGAVDPRVLALAVYGWMPTVLGRFDEGGVLPGLVGAEAYRSVSSIKDVKTAYSFLCGMGDIAPVNHSWIGTSKFLHFINPMCFPIWDSRVALKFGVTSYGAVNKKKAYLTYCNFVWNRAGVELESVDRIQELVRNDYKYDISRVRAIELLLFLG